MATNKNEPQQETNQRAISEDDEEWMDGASSAFPKAENLAPAVPPNYGPGRLLAIWALSTGERKNDEGKLYPFVETVTLVLDDGPDGSQTDELVGPAPVKLEGFQHSTTGLVSRLLKRVEGTNAKGVRLKYRPMVGRLNTQASSRNKNVPAFSIAEPTAADMDIVRKHKDMILSINKGLEAADKASEDSEAFE
jgi:hypothetical protein